MQAPEALPWNEIKDTIHATYPPILKKTVFLKNILRMFFILHHFFQHRLPGIVGANWAQLCWHPWRIIFLFTSALNVHVSPMGGARSRCGWLPNKLESTKLPIQNGTHHLLYTNSMLVNSSRFWTNVYCSSTSANQLPPLLDKNDSVWKHHLLVAHFSVCHSATLFNIKKSHFYYLSCINDRSRGL